MESQSLVPLPDPQARRWAMLCHYAAFFWFLAPLIGNVLGTLIVWQLQKDRDPFVDWHGKEALNFQLSMLIYTVAAIPLICLCVGILLLVLIHVANFVFIIVAAVRAAGSPRAPVTRSCHEVVNARSVRTVEP